MISYEKLYFKMFGKPMPSSARPRMDAAINGMDEKYRELLIDRLQGKTLQAIAETRGITRQRVAQLEKEAISQCMTLAYYGTSKSIDYLKIPTATKTLLKRNGITNTEQVKELVKSGKLIKIKGMGVGKATAVMKALIEKGEY